MVVVDKSKLSVDKHEVEKAWGYLAVHLRSILALLLVLKLFGPDSCAHLLKHEQNKDCSQEIHHSVCYNIEVELQEANLVI